MSWGLVSGLLGFALSVAAQEGERAPLPLDAVQIAPLAAPVAAGVVVEVVGENGAPVANALVAVLPARACSRVAPTCAPMRAAHGS